jgi:hypothetical protein
MSNCTHDHQQPSTPVPEPARAGEHYSDLHKRDVRERCDGSLVNRDGSPATDGCGRPLYNNQGTADTRKPE